MAYNYFMIGMDEVGRGSWAGPLLVVAARHNGMLPLGIDDSKKLTKARRLFLIPNVKDACDIGEGWVTPQEIDRFGLAAALRLGASRALATINAIYNEPIILDGVVNYISSKYTNVLTKPKADANYPIVSAASIWAKVRRDEFMFDLSKKYGQFGFERNVGYGTDYHLKALATHGPIMSVHRYCFKPVQAAITM